MDWLFKKLNISPSERARVSYLWSLRVLFQVGFIFSWTILTAIFVEMFGIEKIIYLFLVDAILVIGGSFLAHFLFLYISKEHFLRGALAGTILFATIAIIFKESVGLFFAAALLAKDLFYAQLNIALLRKNESLFSPTEAQKIMPILDSAITIGTIGAAMIFLGLLSILGTKDLLAFWLVPLLGMLYIIWNMPHLINEIPDLEQNKKTKRNKSTVEVQKAFEKIPFLKYMFGVVLLQSALFVVLEFNFLKSVASHAPVTETHFDASLLQANLFLEAKEGMEVVTHKVSTIAKQVFAHETLAHDLGVLSLIFGVIGLFVQCVLASNILGRFGIINSMIIYFVGLLGVVGTFIAGGVSMNIVRGYQHGFHSIFGAAYHLSFYSIFSHRRETLRHFFEGFIAPAGIILGGLSVLLVNHLWGSVDMWLIPVFGVLIIGIMIPMKSHYTKISKENLKSEKSITAQLHSIEVLGQKGHGEAVMILGEELRNQNSHPVIREKLIGTLSKINNPQIVHIYLELLASEEEGVDVKIKILDSLLTIEALKKYWEVHAFSQHHLLLTLQKMFKETQNKHIKKLVIMNIFRHLPVHQVVPFFIQMLKEADDDLKSVCFRSCTQLFNDIEISYYIKSYLSHENSKLKGHAIISLWEFEDKGELREIIYKMLESDDMEQKISAIYAMGEVKDTESEDLLKDLYLSSEGDLRIQILVALAKLGNREVLDPVLEVLLGEDVVLANKLYSMLKRAPEEMQEIIKREVNFAVAKKIWEILSIQKKEAATKNDFSEDVKVYLKRLYHMTERYDDILRIETI